MTTVTIGGNTFESYADVAMADAYLGASFTATAWRAETDPDQKGRALVEATRLIDRQSWAGEKTAEEQPGAWPRSGIEGVDDYAVPDAVVAATSELAAAFIAGETDVLTNGSTESNIRALRAGSVAIEYFRLADVDVGRFPLIIQELLGQYLSGGGSGAISGPYASGVDTCSSFRRNYGLNRSF